MTITYQGNNEDTEATTVWDFLNKKGVDVRSAIIELDGEIIADMSIPLKNGSVLNVFRIVSGG